MASILTCYAQFLIKKDNTTYIWPSLSPMPKLQITQSSTELLSIAPTTGSQSGVTYSTQVAYSSSSDCIAQFVYGGTAGYLEKTAVKLKINAGTFAQDRIYFDSSTTSYVEASITFSPCSYTVYFNGNQGTPSQASKSVTNLNTYGTLPTATRPGYSFNGWYTSTTGGTQITSSTGVLIKENQTLFAQWTQQQYTIQYAANGGTGDVPASQTANVNSSITVSSADLNKENYRRNGWNTQADGSGTNYADGSTFIGTSAGTTTLYAKWEEIPQGSSGIKVFNGENWVDMSNLKMYNGSSWESISIKRYDGTQWV